MTGVQTCALPISQDHAAAERARNNGKLPARSRAGQRILEDINARVVGWVATSDQINDAVQAAIDEGIDPKEAEAYFAPRRRTFSQWATGSW